MLIPVRQWNVPGVSSARINRAIRNSPARVGLNERNEYTPPAETSFMAHLLGIDIGTSGTKTLICDEDGDVLATATAQHSISSPKPLWSEQDPQEWWEAT